MTDDVFIWLLILGFGFILLSVYLVTVYDPYESVSYNLGMLCVVVLFYGVFVPWFFFGVPVWQIILK